MKDFFIFSWIASRLAERTTWDGVILIAAGLSFFLLKPVASFVAVLAVLYGIWTILQPEF